jgi:uncharacterized protein GlcG (DUF336 family)
MSREEVQAVINKMFDHIDSKIDAYKTSEADWKISDGNVAVCIIDDEGNVYGKIWGQNKVRGRSFYDVAYRKASQVWITGYKTGEYEKLVFSDALNYRDFGIELPDLMGWEGGQPLQIDSDTRISCGFSGFKGVNDLAIVKNALESVL